MECFQGLQELLGILILKSCQDLAFFQREFHAAFVDDQVKAEVVLDSWAALKNRADDI